jgi:hypothetical protein
MNPGHPAHSLVIILNELQRLSFAIISEENNQELLGNLMILCFSEDAVKM